MTNPLQYSNAVSMPARIGLRARTSRLLIRLATIALIFILAGLLFWTLSHEDAWGADVRHSNIDAMEKASSEPPYAM